MATNTRVFTDLDLDFGKHPVTGDVNKVFNDVAVKRSIRNLLKYNFYEKPWEPEFGANLTGQLGELHGPFADNSIKDRIIHLIRTEEPRASLVHVQVRNEPDNNSLFASITFTLVNFPNEITVDVFLDRLR